MARDFLVLLRGQNGYAWRVKRNASTKPVTVFPTWHLFVLSAFLCLALTFCRSHQAWALVLYDDRAVAMAVDIQGNVYVTGDSDTNGGSEIATIKYAPDGKLLWIQREIAIPARAIAIDEEGNVYVAGGVYSLPGKENNYSIVDYKPSIDTDYITIKYSPDGTRLWMRRYNGTANSIDVATAVTVDAWGNVLVTGYSYAYSYGGYKFSDYVTIKYSPEGHELWVRRYNGPANETDDAVAIGVDDDGNVYVTGTSYGGDITKEDYATIKYSPEGEERWVSRYMGEPDTQFSSERAIALVVDGEFVYVTGSTGNYDTVKYSAGSGEMAWRRRYNGPANGIDVPRAMCVDDEGNIYVTGVSPGSGTLGDFATVKYTPAGVEDWVSRYNGTGNSSDEASAIAVDTFRNVYVTGDSGDDYATIKYDPTGNELWVSRYNGTVYGTDIPAGIGLDVKGNVYVTGYSEGVYTSADYATVAYTTEGEELWVKRYTGVETQSDRASGITVDRQGNVYVTGASYRDGASRDYATVAYSPAGKLLWEKRYNGSINGLDEAIDIGTDGQKNIYVTGDTNYNHDYATIAYRATDGKRLWIRRYRQPDSLLVNARALAVNAQGNVAVTGYSYNFNTSFDYSTVAYNASGKRLWAKIYNGAANKTDDPSSMAMDAEGNVYVTGGTARANGQPDYLTIKYSAAGHKLWERHYGGDSNSDYAEDIAVDGKGNVYVSGWTLYPFTRDVAPTIKYNAGGGRRWVSLYDVPEQSNDIKAIAVDGQGNVYVTGVSTAGDGDYLTIKYSQSGKERWVRRYNGAGNSTDIPSDIAVDDEGNVYVTGYSYGDKTFSDYATVKYSPDGQELWVRRYNGTGNSWDNAVGLALDGKGHVYVTGTSNSGTETADDYVTIKYRTSDGKRLWVRQYHGAEGPPEE